MLRMAAEFESVELSEFTSAGELQKIADSSLRLTFDRKDKEEALLFQKGNFWTFRQVTLPLKEAIL